MDADLMDPPVGTPAATSAGSPRVLLVEDDGITAAVLVRSLVRLGYDVLGTVSDGCSALRHATNERPDVVLMDIQLEGEMDGIEAGWRLRKHYGIPVVYLSASADDGTLARAAKTRPWAYLVKPVSEPSLHAALQMAMLPRLARRGGRALPAAVAQPAPRTPDDSDAAARRERPSLVAELRRDIQQPGALERALAAGEFRLHYQPVVDLRTGLPVCWEALLRWQHPQHGLLGPEYVVPLAEASGTIAALGAWTLEAAARQLAAWHAGGLAEMRVSVNVSGRHLREADFVARLERTLRLHGIAPGHLELELTEDALLGQSPAQLAALAGCGVRITLDDHGGSHSSLTALRALKLRRCKIDPVFVQRLPGSDADAAALRDIVAVARHDGIVVVAEGVEDDAQARCLVELGCHQAQGYLFARPMPAEAAAAHARRALDRLAAAG